MTPLGRKQHRQPTHQRPGGAGGHPRIIGGVQEQDRRPGPVGLLGPALQIRQGAGGGVIRIDAGVPPAGRGDPLIEAADRARGVHAGQGPPFGLRQAEGIGQGLAPQTAHQPAFVEGVAGPADGGAAGRQIERTAQTGQGREPGAHPSPDGVQQDRAPQGKSGGGQGQRQRFPTLLLLPLAP